MIIIYLPHNDRTFIFERTPCVYIVMGSRRSSCIPWYPHVASLPFIEWTDTPVRRLIALSFADSFVSDVFIKTKQQKKNSAVLSRSSHGIKKLFYRWWIDMMTALHSADDLVEQETIYVWLLSHVTDYWLLISKQFRI